MDENIKRTEEWLDERYAIMQMEETNPSDRAYYNGAITACEFLGYEWKRDENGKHTLIGGDNYDNSRF